MSCIKVYAITWVSVSEADCGHWLTRAVRLLHGEVNLPLLDSLERNLSIQPLLKELAIIPPSIEWTG